MWILGVAFGRASAAWSPLAAGRRLGATPQPPWCRWGERCGIALGYAQAVWVAGTCRRGPRGRGSGWKYYGASGHARSMGPAAAQAHRNASGLAPWAMQPRAANGAGAWPCMRLLRSQARAKCPLGVLCWCFVCTALILSHTCSTPNRFDFLANHIYNVSVKQCATACGCALFWFIHIKVLG